MALSVARELVVYLKRFVTSPVDSKKCSAPHPLLLSRTSVCERLKNV